MKAITCLLGLSLLLFCACGNKKTKEDPMPTPVESYYPTEIAQIMRNSCANAGCHDGVGVDPTQLSLNTWENMFKGASYGGVIVPYRPSASYLFYHLNAYPSLGGVASLNFMPPASFSAPLDSVTVLKIKDWIANGAPNKDGVIKFADDPNRKKVYVANSGCDLVSVIDVETNLIMRHVGVGSKKTLGYREGSAIGTIQSPHYLKVSPDGQYWYVTIIGTNGRGVEKYRTSDDSFVGSITLPITFDQVAHIDISSDGKKGIISNYNTSNPAIAVLNLETMTLTKVIAGIGGGKPHGLVFLNDNTIFVTGYLDNQIYKVNLTSEDILETIAIDKPSLGKTNTNPYDIMLNADKTKLYASCKKTNEMVEVDVTTNMVTRRVDVGASPALFDIDTQNNLLYVACQLEPNTSSNSTGCVSVIDLSNFTEIKKIYNVGNQPRVVRVCEFNHTLYVCNENVNGQGVPPHHASECGGNIGYVTLVDLTTKDRKVGSFENQLFTQPIGMDIRK